MDFVLKPGDNIKPQLNSEDAKKLILDIYGLEVVKIKELNSYDDKNFYIKVSPQHNNQHLASVSEDGYVFKVTNSLDSHNPALFEAQNLFLEHLHKKGFNTPQPVADVNKETLSIHDMSTFKTEEWKENNDTDANASKHLVRLLTFVPGSICYNNTYTKEMLYSLGEYLAKLITALEDFSSAAVTERKFIWMLESVPQLKQFVYAVESEEHKEMVNSVIDEFTRTVIPLMSTLPTGTIHGDYNDQNILVDNNSVIGLIDMGDIQVAPHVFEVGMACMYMGLECTTMDKLDAPAHLLAGYLSQRELADKEFNILKILMESRLAQSLVLGRYTYLQDPGNEYLLTTEKTGWNFLHLLKSTPQEKLYTRWREIIHSYK